MLYCDVSAQLKCSYMEEGRKEMFYLTTHSTHVMYGYVASDILEITTQIAREESRFCHMSYSFRLAARVLLYASSHRQDITFHGVCYTSRGALDKKRNSLIGPPGRIDPTTHRTMSERSYHRVASCSCSYMVSVPGTETTQCCQAMASIFGST